MQRRRFDSEGYRYGFNGKENDNEVKGSGNQQDYGMRIYDPRIGRFLSVDPLTRTYPYYSPYQFAGNKPIWAIDLDGEEPAFRNKVTHIPSDYDKMAFDDRIGTYKGLFQAYAAQDVDKRTYLIYETINATRQWYREYDASGFKNSEATEFQWQQAKTDRSLDYAMGAMITAPFAFVEGVAAGSTYAGSAVSSYTTNLVTRGIMWYWRYAPQMGVAGRFAADVLDETGTIGAQNSAANSFFRNPVIQTTIKDGEKFLYSTFNFTGSKSGQEIKMEFGGQLTEKGKDLIIHAAQYLSTGGRQLTNLEAPGELGRTGLNEFKELLKKNFGSGFDRIIINYDRVPNSSSKNPGSSGQFIINVNE
jgi:RHS repeat-associated protein